MQIDPTSFFWVSIVMFFVTLGAVPLVIIALPSDYFAKPKRKQIGIRGANPMLALFALVAKNVLGVAVIIFGIAMLVLPGQGILTILIGLSFVDFPGKYRLERRLVRITSVRRALDWVRLKAGKPPLRF